MTAHNVYNMSNVISTLRLKFKCIQSSLIHSSLVVVIVCVYTDGVVRLTVIK